LVERDPRSRSYDVRGIVDRTQPRSYTWRVGAWLDQGREGACVGFAWAHEIAARPKVHDVTPQLATTIYHEARKIDPWPGENYDGTSVLAGVKVAQRLGYFHEYRWAFSLQDALTVVSRHGPAVIGVNWYSGMWDTDANGYIRPTGSVVGGHAIVLNGVNVKGRYATLHNSWGPRWGVNGSARITWDDLGRLLDERGEVCVPVVRR
jgi:hypothetical protein